MLHIETQPPSYDIYTNNIHDQANDTEVATIQIEHSPDIQKYNMTPDPSTE